MRWILLIVLLGSCWLVGPKGAIALDVRYALLIGHEQGWKRDPKLKYVLQGDLYPLKRQLKRLGFRIKVLQNPTATTVRQTFKKLQKRLQRSPKITTFLFYYTGHADQQYFHLGKRGKKPLSYKEFVKFFHSVKVRRRVAILDACYSGEAIRQFGDLTRYRKYLRQGNPKGVRARRKLNLRKLLIPNQGKEQGIRIISSSLELSWELHRYRASTFTYYLLLGLRGRADLNHDGKITLDELFDYASREVTQQTGQRPQQLAIVKRESPYALAPAYNSRLWIGGDVQGHLKISVANFVWSKKKRSPQPLRLSTVYGKGEVFLRRRKECFHQSIKFPKGREIRLKNNWRKISCIRMGRVPKGVIRLPASAYIPMDEDDLLSSRLMLVLGAGWSQLGVASLSANHLDFSFGGRWRFLGFSFHYLNGQPLDKSYQLSRFLLRGQLGWPLWWRGGGSDWRVFAGLYGQAGITTQHPENFPVELAFSTGGGAFAELGWQWSPRWGIQLQTQVGADYTPVRNKEGLSLHLSVMLSVVWSPF